MMKIDKRILALLVLLVVIVGPLVTVWIKPNIQHIITFNDFDYTLDSGIISLAPPGIVPSPPSVLQFTGVSNYVKTPHALEGRIGFCFDCHGLNGQIPAPASHLGRPQDTCTVCHRPVWEIIEQ